jgi:hypothetical protein
VKSEEVALIDYDQPPGSLEDQATTASLVRADEQQFGSVVPLENHPVAGIHCSPLNESARSVFNR